MAHFIYKNVVYFKNACFVGGIYIKEVHVLKDVLQNCFLFQQFSNYSVFPLLRNLTFVQLIRLYSLQLTQEF